MDIKSFNIIDEYRFRECLELAYKYSSESNFIVNLPNGINIAWGNFIKILYKHNILKNNYCSARKLALP